MIDLTPELIEFEDGTTALFYSPRQLEEMREQRFEYKPKFDSKTHHPLNGTSFEDCGSKVSPHKLNE